MKTIRIFLVAVVFNLCQNGIITVDGSIAAQKDLTLNSSQKRALDKFKNLMDPVLAKDYYRKEVYLIRWLRAAGFDINRAERMLLDNLQWREKFNMDTIHDEDWSEFDREFPYFTGSVDKEFQPIITCQMGKWDFRQTILSGKRTKMVRYFFKLFDDLEIAVQKQQEKGEFVTRGTVISDVEGFNLIQHGCVQCIGMFVELVRAMDNNFPGLFDKMIVVNVPSTFEAIVNIVKQAMTPESRESLEILGSNRRKWEKYLLERIDEDQLPLELGGNYIHEINNDYQY